MLFSCLRWRVDAAAAAARSRRRLNVERWTLSVERSWGRHSIIEQLLKKFLFFEKLPLGKLWLYRCFVRNWTFICPYCTCCTQDKRCISYLPTYLVLVPTTWIPFLSCAARFFWPERYGTMGYILNPQAVTPVGKRFSSALSLPPEGPKCQRNNYYLGWVGRWLFKYQILNISVEHCSAAAHRIASVLSGLDFELATGQLVNWSTKYWNWC